MINIKKANVKKVKIKSWKEVTKPFRDAAKKSGFSKENLKELTE